MKKFAVKQAATALTAVILATAGIAGLAGKRAGGSDES